jgi:hypothetical protein
MTVPAEVDSLIAVSCSVVSLPLWYTMPNMMVRSDTQKMSYESVKKPVPATTMARTWYQPKGALSISASARRRRSLGSSMWAKSLLKLWKLRQRQQM